MSAEPLDPAVFTADGLVRVRLADICHARSGDKGRHCTVGLVVWDPRLYETVVDVVTESVVADHFGDLVHGPVHRYLLPGIHAISFVLEDSLDGGGVRSLRIDAQGKAMCEAFLRLEVEVSEALARVGEARRWRDESGDYRTAAPGGPDLSRRLRDDSP